MVKEPEKLWGQEPDVAAGWTRQAMPANAAAARVVARRHRTEERDGARSLYRFILFRLSRKVVLLRYETRDCSAVGCVRV
jgi:hypothetical protein